MRKQFIMLSFFGALGMVGCLSAPASADDVYVDLSVLRELQDTSSVANVPAPLFPEIKSSRSSVSSPAVRHKSVKPQKAKPRKRVAKEDSQDKIVIPEKVVPVTGLKVSVPSIELKTVSENMEKDAAAPVAAIKKESLPELKTEPTPTPDLSSEAAQVTAQPVISQAFEAAKEKAENENSVPANNEQIADNSVQPVPALIDKKTTQNPSVTQPSDNEMVFIPQTNVSAPLTMQSSTVSEVMSSTQQSAENVIQENNQPQLLVSAPSVNTKAGATEIEFAPGSEELTSDNQQKLDAIIASFENPTDNMIAINAYNYNDGNDVFSKKRLSLRRIVAIRSYLLNKGYKNFMPKVINITDDNGKSDLVELEEIK